MVNRFVAHRLVYLLFVATACAGSDALSTTREPAEGGKGGGRRSAAASPDADETEVEASEASAADARRRTRDRTGPKVPGRSDARSSAVEGWARRPPSSPGVRAGAADDNLQFHAFLRFSEENGHLGLAHVVEDRVVLEVRDQEGRPVAGARVEVDGQLRRVTYADGRTLLHPKRWGSTLQAEVVVSGAGGRTRTNLGVARGRKLEVTLDGHRGTFDAVPLDVAFVMDTTGSMGDELARLRETLDVIVFQISQMKPRPRIRLAMVLYRDREDDYITRKIPFTEDLSHFGKSLDKISAAGGGDTPEDVQSGLRVALHDLKWRNEGLQLAFLVGDAPPHLDYQQTTTYIDSLEAAARRGIKITTVGASGLDLRGELVWRQIAQATMAPFVFLTYGETGDMEGSVSTVSHHVGSNWVAADLDAIIVKMVRAELAHYHDRVSEPRQDWFSATSNASMDDEAVLEELFDRSVKQLVDYAVEPLDPRTPTMLLPLTIQLQKSEEARARLERRLSLGLSRKREFQLLETRKQRELQKTLAQQMSLAYDEAKFAQAGRLFPAKLAVLGQVGRGNPGQVEMLLKLVRLATGEVVSVSLLKIDEKLLQGAT